MYLANNGIVTTEMLQLGDQIKIVIRSIVFEQNEQVYNYANSKDYEIHTHAG